MPKQKEVCEKQAKRENLEPGVPVMTMGLSNSSETDSEIEDWIVSRIVGTRSKGGNPVQPFSINDVSSIIHEGYSGRSLDDYELNNCNYSLSFQSSSLNESAQSGTGTSPSSESTHEVSEIVPPTSRFTRVRKVPDRYRESIS